MKLLALTSAVQLGLGLAGLRTALRHRIAYDLRFVRGSRENIGRDAWLMGTAFSAPVVMLALQAVCTTRLLVRPAPRAARALGLLGLAMSLGCPAEHAVRQSWRHPDASVTAITAGVAALAVVMAWLGLRPTAGDDAGR